MEDPPKPVPIGIGEAARISGYSTRNVSRLVDSGHLIGGRPDHPGAWRWVDAEDARLLGEQRRAAPGPDRDAVRERRAALRRRLHLSEDGADLVPPGPVRRRHIPDPPGSHAP